MDALFNDLRYSLRRLVRAPVFALVAIATVALGIGANTAIFSFVNAVLFKAPGGVQDPEHVVEIFTSDFSGPLYSSSSYPDFEEFRKQSDLFSRVAAITGSPINVVRGRQVERDVRGIGNGRLLRSRRRTASGWTTPAARRLH